MFEDWKLIDPLNIPQINLTIRGYSVAALKTSFYIPELNILLDCGLKTGFTPDSIFITHSHADHSHELPTSFMDLNHNKNSIYRPVNIFVPEQIYRLTRNFIDATYKFSTSNWNHDKVHSNYNLYGVEAGRTIEMKIRNRDFKVEVIKCDHSVPTVGYGFIELRKKLKEEYLNLPGKDIKEHKESGVEVTTMRNFPLLCYLGDTTPRVFRNRDLRKYPAIMIECTYLYPEHRSLAEENKHTHWEDLKPHIKSIDETTFILYHFSQRYKPSDIRHFFADKPENVVVWTEKIDKN